MSDVVVQKKPKKSFKLFIMLLPCLAFVFIFSYLPLRGWIYAFTDYKAGLPWSKVNFVGLDNFTKMFANEALRAKVGQVMINTVAMAALNIVFSPLAAIFAIFLNEMRSRKYQRVVQSLTTLPHFISWVIMYSVAFFMLSNSGFVNTLLLKLGVIESPINFLATPNHVWITMKGYDIWKGLGWSAIIYLAAIAGIDQEQYEAAMIDGASRMQKIWYITVPGLFSTYFVLLIMSIGNFLNTGMEQFYVFQNAMNKEHIEVLDLYVYNLGIGTSNNIPFATAVGIMKSGMALLLFAFANILSMTVRGTSVF